MSGYTVEKVDRIMEQMVMALFADIKSIPEQELITHQYVQRTNEHLATLSQLQSLKSQKEKELASYKSEVYKSIQGKSTWSQELLSELIQEAKVEIEKLDAEIDTAKALVDDADKAAKDIKEQYDRILTWADMFEGSTLEGKKMIMWQLIEKVRIYRDYQFEVDLKPTVKEFKALWSKRSTQSTNGAA